jgi:site-specific DNA-adenine methylase
MSQYGIPYMGSKAKIAASICMNFPKSTHFYDLFGGGFSITHYMLTHRSKRHQFFHFNEIKPCTVELIQKAIHGEFNYSKFKPPWVSREDFIKNKDTNAYIRILWSFGNNQSVYLFSPKIEPYKKSMHMAVVFDEFDELATQTFGFDRWPSQAKTITQKRAYLGQLIGHYRLTRLPKHLIQFLNDKQLEQLQRLQQLQQLNFYTTDYQNVPILPDSIIYCDPPYQNTTGYLKEFDHKSFLDWAANLPHPVYISEYFIDDSRFECVYEVDKRVLLSADNLAGTKPERLYWNKVKVSQ